MHAILGGSAACIAAHPSDMCVALAALDAEVRVVGERGSRKLKLTEFHVLPGVTPEVETVLAPGELVTHVLLPNAAFARHSAYVKARDRASFAFALASAAVALELEGELIKQARVALGGVATKPWRSREVEQALVGQRAVREVFERVAPVSASAARTTTDNAFKVKLIQRVLVRALERARAVT
jgi:xanthine dehydrogenase YagS FAD-binding subunit